MELKIRRAVKEDCPRLLELVRERLLNDLMKMNGAAEKLDRLALEIAEKKTNPYAAVEEIVK